eukprot:scaffold518_cov388-Prasinococcus_capsulatus_cf.AAC.81
MKRWHENKESIRLDLNYDSFLTASTQPQSSVRCQRKMQAITSGSLQYSHFCAPSQVLKQVEFAAVFLSTLAASVPLIDPLRYLRQLQTTQADISFTVSILPTYIRACDPT